MKWNTKVIVLVPFVILRIRMRGGGMRPMLRVKNKKGEFVYFESKDIRPCRICVRAFDPNDKFDSADKLENCRAFEVTILQFEELKLNTRVYTDCLQHLQGWVEIKR